jgi:hypothetical protein
LSKDSEWIGVALNRTRNEFVSLSNQSVKKLIVNGVQINWRDRVRLSAPRQVRGGKWEPIAGWMDGVMIGVVTMHSEATFARDKQVPHFVVTERSAVGSR